MKPIKGIYYECPICCQKYYLESIAERCIWKHSLPQYCSRRESPTVIKKAEYTPPTKQALVLVSNPHE